MVSSGWRGGRGRGFLSRQTAVSYSHYGEESLPSCHYSLHILTNKQALSSSLLSSLSSWQTLKERAQVVAFVVRHVLVVQTTYLVFVVGRIIEGLRSYQHHLFRHCMKQLLLRVLLLLLMFLTRKMIWFWAGSQSVPGSVYVWVWVCDYLDYHENSYGRQGSCQLIMLSGKLPPDRFRAHFMDYLGWWVLPADSD